MAAKFGTSGLRGLVGELDDGTAAAHSAAFFRHLLSTGAVAPGSRVYFGQDLRPSSAEISAQCMAAAEDEGLEPVDCGPLPTPALAAFAMARDAAAIMVTGSHIPADRNGVKFYRPDGEIDKNDEAAIASGVPSLDRAAMRWTPHHRPLDQSAEALDAFAERYRGALPDGCLAGRRIGVYEHSTVIRDMLADILAPSGAELVSIGRSDVFVPVDTEAVSDQTRARIHSWTERYNLDVLISADGDADRPLIADETGQVLRGDVLGLLVARLLEADAVVTPVTSSSGIESRVGARAGAKVLRTRVGSPFVIAAMAEAAEAGAQRIVGFEANGGVLTASPFTLGTARLAPLPTRDCVLPLLAALAASLAAGKTLSTLVAELALPVAVSGRIEDFPSKKGSDLVTSLTGDAAFRDRFLEPIGKPASLDTTDGLRMTLADGRILHLRPSGNAPEMRVYAEASTADEAEALVAAAVRRILD
jgi:phosphomannomutase